MTELFTEKEQEIIEKCISRGLFDSIAAALISSDGFTMTQEKEHALQQILNERRPIVLDESSEVLQELQKEQMKGYRIETQEDEAKWQAKFDAERAKKIETIRGTGGNAVINIPEGNETDMTKLEIMEELTKQGIQFRPAQSKVELLALLEKQPA